MIQWNVIFTGVEKRNGERSRKRIMVFEMSREDAVKAVIETATSYGYENVTVDHIARIET